MHIFFISGMRQNLESLHMRQQEALPLVLKEQTEKKKLLFNKQLLLHVALILCQCHICGCHITICIVVNHSYRSGHLAWPRQDEKAWKGC